MKNLIIYAITTLIFFVIDMTWLGLVAKNFYRQKLGFILSPDVKWVAAIIFYLIYIGGILYFAVLPALKDQSWQTALINGAVLGFLCYATYDLTNMATIKDWPLTIVIVDIVWGMVLTGAVSILSYIISNRLPG
jgi:uncharacterized membrane protein